MATDEAPEREPAQPWHRSWKEVATEILGLMLTGGTDRPQALAQELIDAFEREQAADRATAEQARAHLLAMMRCGGGPDGSPDRG